MDGDLNFFALKYKNLSWIDQILIISPLRVGVPHRKVNKLAKYKWIFVFSFFLKSALIGTLKILHFSANYFFKKKRYLDLHNSEILLEILTDKPFSFYRETPNEPFRFLNVARVFPNKTDVLCPVDLINRIDIFPVLILSIRELFFQILCTLRASDLQVKYKILVISWKIRHIQDFIVANCIELSKLNIRIYVDWFENQVIDATINRVIKKRNIEVYYVSDYLVDTGWHLNLNPSFWRQKNDKSHFGAILKINYGTNFMSWWSTRLFRNKVLETPVSSNKRVVFIYPFQVDLAKNIARVQNDFAKTQSKYEIVVKRHPNSNFKEVLGNETDVFFKNDTIVSIQTSLIAELYYQGVRDIAVLQLEDYAEAGLPKGSYRIINNAKDILN